MRMKFLFTVISVVANIAHEPDVHSSLYNMIGDTPYRSKVNVVGT